MSTSINQLRMNMLDSSPLFNNSRAESLKINKILEEENQDEKVFAQKGEDNYNKAMDFNGDGVVTYDEYMRYCEENAVSQCFQNPTLTCVSKSDETSFQIQNIRPIHIGKALETYSHFGEEQLLPYIETEV